MKTEYDLFLDESGEFKDHIKVREVSLVGGLLFPQGNLTEVKAKQLLNEAYFEAGLDWKESVHATETKVLSYSKYWYMIELLLRKVLAAGGRAVVYENVNKANIVNADVTYLHVLSEGITQTLQTLTTSDDEVVINIVASRRMGKNGTEEMVVGEYLDRLRERLHLEWVRRGRYGLHRKWELKGFTIGSARKSYCLMLADHVCHSWYCVAERERIRHAYDPYVFSVLRVGQNELLDSLLNAGALSQACFDWLGATANAEMEHGDAMRYRAKFTLEYKCLPYLWRKRSIQQTLSLIEEFVGVEYMLALADRMGSLFSDFLREVVLAEPHLFTEEIFKAGRIRLSLHNHAGRIACAHQELLALAELYPPMLSRLENMTEVFEAMICEGVHLCNCYAFDIASEKMGRLIEVLRELAQLVPCLLPLSDVTIMYSDLLGKAYGTRLQAHTFRTRTDRSCYKLAVQDSEEAIMQFHNPQDQERQYLYRCQLECDQGNAPEALRWLLKATQTNTIDELAGYLQNNASVSARFVMANYCRLMAHAPSELACSMYAVWGEKQLDRHPTLNLKEHPVEIICWKLGTYLLRQGDMPRGISWHQRALKISLSNPEQLTLITIGLAILAEQCAYVISNQAKFKASGQKLEKRLSALLATPGLPDSMHSYFASWVGVVQQPCAKASVEELLKLAWTVPF
ncbi:MAG: hypothetical protein FD169_1880 [Bacillota bacterium]|nr:MAG: hypothetical protein FD169_1880 [Bacillota bacterium]